MRKTKSFQRNAAIRYVSLSATEEALNQAKPENGQNLKETRYKRATTFIRLDRQKSLRPE